MEAHPPGGAEQQRRPWGVRQASEFAGPAAAAADAPRPWETGQRRRPPYQGVKWAAEYTGVGRRTVQRRMDAWMDPDRPDRTSYGIRSSKRPNARGDRLVDPVDAERVRLQEAGALDASVTTEQWDQMIADGSLGSHVALLLVTDEDWFRALLG